MPRKNKYHHIYRIDNARERSWRLVVRRGAFRVLLVFRDQDHHGKNAAMAAALNERERVLSIAPLPHWCARPKKNTGVFERQRGKHRTVTVAFPGTLQSYRGEVADFPFNDSQTRALAWRAARSLRKKLVRLAELKFPTTRPSRRWEPGL